MTAVTEGPDLAEAPAGDEERAAFRVDGLGTAAWAMQHALKLAERQREIELAAEAEVDRWQTWAAREIEKLQGDRRFFEGVLERYALEQRAADPRRKSISTPFGMVTTRDGGGSWVVDDEAAAIAALREARPELIRRVEKLDRFAAKQALEVEDGRVVDTISGEVIPGIVVGPSGVTARVKLEGFA